MTWYVRAMSVHNNNNHDQARITQPNVTRRQTFDEYKMQQVGAQANTQCSSTTTAWSKISAHLFTAFF